MTSNAYLKLDGVQGESRAAGHEGEIELLDWKWGCDQSLNIGSQSSGAGAGKIKFRSLSITKLIDKSSPVLFVSAASGRAFLTGHLTVLWSVGTSPGAFDLLKLELKTAAIKSIALAQGDPPVEQVEIEFGAVKITHVPEGADGKPQDPVSGGWDAIRNVAWN
jgi:type VI secretion system secreted protein Hcp